MIIRWLLILSIPLFAQAPPAPDAAALPALETLLKALGDKQEATRALSEAYGYSERTTMKILDSNGKLQKVEVKEFEVTPIHGKSIKRLLKVDGIPLSEKAAAKEDARVIKAAEKAAEDPSGSVKQVGLRSLMKFWNVTGLRRGRFGQAEALILDFVPKGKVETKNKPEEIASKLAGTVFLDEQTLDALHLDVRLLAPVRVFGFLGSMAEGGTLTQEFQRVNGEISMPAKSQGRFPARVLFSHVFIEISTEWFDFKKFSLEGTSLTDAQVIPAKTGGR